MPHEYLEYEKSDAEGLLLSADLLTQYKEEEKEAMDKEQRKSPQMKKGSSRASQAKKKMPGRMKNLGKRKK